jgi:hypothetical protein
MESAGRYAFSLLGTVVVDGQAYSGRIVVQGNASLQLSSIIRPVSVAVKPEVVSG